MRERLRRLEWQVVRADQARAIGRIVASKAHDLSNAVQVVQLATRELSGRCDASARGVLDELAHAAVEAGRAVAELMTEVAATRDAGGDRGAPIGPAVAAVEAALRPLAIALRLEAAPDRTVRCSAIELEHVLLGLAIDAAARVERAVLVARERVVDGARWLEIRRAGAERARARPSALASLDRHELCVVETIVRRAGGNLVISKPEAGDAVVTLPIGGRT